MIGDKNSCPPPGVARGMRTPPFVREIDYHLALLWWMNGVVFIGFRLTGRGKAVQIVCLSFTSQINMLLRGPIEIFNVFYSIRASYYEI